MAEYPRRRSRVPAAWFADLYACDPDPWHFDDSEYERRKHHLTVASLPRSHYGAGFEPGCSNGALTRLLAPRCTQLLASDVVASVVATAAAALHDRAGVRVEQRSIPDEWPDERFDLVVLSEVGYYLSCAELEEVVTRTVESLEPSGHLLAVHWLGTTDYPIPGAEVHALIDRAAQLDQVVRHEEAEFELRCWERR